MRIHCKKSIPEKGCESESVLVLCLSSSFDVFLAYYSFKNREWYEKSGSYSISENFVWIYIPFNKMKKFIKEKYGKRF